MGGTVNLVDQALKGNVTSLREGLAYFGTGAAAGIAVSFGQVGLARVITVGGNKITQAVTGKFSFSVLDSPGDIASLVLDVGTDLLSPGLTQALSKPITKAITARVLAKAIDDAVVSGGGEFIKRTLSKEAAEELAKNSIEWSLVPTEEFVVTASRVASTAHINYVTGVTAKTVVKEVAETSTRIGRDGRAVEVLFKDGSKLDINAARVKEWIPNTHPKAPPGTLQKVKFDNFLPSSRGFKRSPTQVEIDFLNSLF